MEKQFLEFLKSRGISAFQFSQLTTGTQRDLQQQFLFEEE